MNYYKVHPNGVVEKATKRDPRKGKVWVPCAICGKLTENKKYCCRICARTGRLNAR